MNKKEKKLFCQAAMDIESGNYLLYPRSVEEINALNELQKTLNTPDEQRTERQKEIFEYYRLCTDYEYAKSCEESANQ